MAADTTSILDAIRSGDLDTLEQLPDEELVEAAQSRKHCLTYESAKSKQWAVMWWLLEKAEQLGDTKLTRGWTRAHCAAAQGDLDLLRALTREELARRTNNGETSVHAAALCDQADAIEFLVRERGLDPSLTMGAVASTPLHVASRAGHVGAIEKLAELGVETDLIDLASCSALMLAVSGRHVEATKSLLRLGCGSHPPRKNANSAMHCAATSGSVEMVDVLVEDGSCDVEELGFMAKRPLHHAAECGDVVMVKHLLGLGAQVNAVDDRGSTALHCAMMGAWKKTKSGMADVLRVLLVAGADRSIKDWRDENARDLAEDVGYESLVGLIDSYCPVTRAMVQLLVGLRGPIESPLARFSSHALFEPRVLSLVKCLLTGEDIGAFSQLVEEVERSYR